MLEVSLLNKTDLEIENLFKRYLDWLNINDIEDTLDTYYFYISNVEKIEFSK